ncbi:hypothetical protein [Foetidibacter luteolus]|uniref:hypothetical protein n=1 Tax=Foetidibacter luteolus TaxID=2608880 RepID=UPI00129A7331|nr:hypothetical protein [Foetidibacter luteolus]
MTEYIINVTEIEELQMTKDINALNSIFQKARSVVVGGGVIRLVRKSTTGGIQPFDELSNEEQLKTYKKQVFKYL